MLKRTAFKPIGEWVKEGRHIAIGWVRDGGDMFIVANGNKVAQRGKPGTPQARTWVSLEPGWSVFDSDNLEMLIVAYNGDRMH